MLTARAIAVVVVVTLGWRGGAAHAEPAPEVLPHLAHVVDVPTAWLAPRGEVWGTAGVSAGDSGLKASTRDTGLMVMVGAGIAGLAEVSVGLSDRLIACKPCDGGKDRASQPAWLGVAGFKVGAAAGTIAPGVPAIALGFETTFGGWAGHDGGDVAPDERVTPDVAQVHLVTSLERAGVRGHAGLVAADAAVIDSAGDRRRMRRGFGQLRPMGGIEVTTAKYPKTTLLAELSWSPELGHDKIQMRWAGSWGVRYQALDWGSIELAVRHRQLEGLEDSTVVIRVNAVSW